MTTQPVVPLIDVRQGGAGGVVEVERYPVRGNGREDLLQEAIDVGGDRRADGVDSASDPVAASTAGLPE